jgi:putative ATP-dependent endonuclease of OLD family
MHISNLKLWNFRRFGSLGPIDLLKPNLDLNLNQGLNVIIGENDSGKTAIIDALKLVLKTHSYEYFKVEDRDFYKETDQFIIEITLSGLEPNEAKNFTEWLGWIGSGEAALPFLKLQYAVKRQGKRIFPSDVKAGVDDGYQLTAEAKEYLKTTYLRPLRDAETELIAKRNSRLSQILLGDSAFRGKEDSNDLLNIFSDLKEKLENYFKGEYTNPMGIVPPEGKIIKDKIDGYIKSFYGPEYETSFESVSTDIKSILEKLTLSLANEPYPGLGTLNRLFMAAELLHLNKDNWSGIRLGLIEELEAHLHPQAQMQVIEALQNQDKIQLILTTHSPNLASKVKLGNIIICCNSYAFPLSSNYTKLEKFDYSFLERFLDTTKANLFFAKGLILVEGWAEEILIPIIAKKIGINLTEKGVSVINVSNTAFLRYSRIFQRKDAINPKIEIPISIITDLDVKPEKEDELHGGIELKTIKKSEKETKYDGDSVKTYVSEHWTLEYCIGVSSSLSKGLFIATKLAGVEMNKSGYTGKRIDVSWLDFSRGKTQMEIGRAIYDEFIGDGKKISKSIIAQYLAQIISNGQSIKREDIEVEPAIKYLIDAINYASGN